MAGGNVLYINPFNRRKQVPAEQEPEKQRERRTITNSVTTTRIGSRAALSLPLASYGIPVPYVIGRQIVIEPNIIWYGGLAPIRQSQSSTSSSSKTDENGDTIVTETKTITYNTIGYRVNMQLALCLGPDVQLLKITSDNETVWEGAIGPARTEFTIDTGFARGGAIFSGGAFDQAPDPYLLDFIPEDLPGYVGVSHIILQNVRTNELGGQLGFEVRRVPNPLELSESDNLSGDDVNCASAMVDIITNGWGGAGTDISKIDIDAALDAAALFASEGNYCSLISRDVVRATELLDILQDQTKSLIFPNPSTGKIVIRPIRKSFYSPGIAPHFGEHNLVMNNGFRAFNKTGWPSTIEQLTATYTNREKHYEVVPVMNQSLPNFVGSGRGKRSAILDYPCVFSEELAHNLLLRDFAEGIEPIFALTLETDSSHSDLVPGDICEINIPRYKLFNVPVYVLKVRRQPLEINTVVLEVRQLVLRDAVPALAPPPNQYDPDLEPVAEPPFIDDGDLITFREAPFWMIKNKGTLTLFNSAKNAIEQQYALLTPLMADGAQSAFFVWADPASDSVGYRLVIGERMSFSWFPPFNGDYWQGASYAAYSKLATSFTKSIAIDTGIIPFIDIDVQAASGALVPAASYWNWDFNGDAASYTEDQLDQGEHFILIHDEILQYESIAATGYDALTGITTFRLTNVHRALLDTVPQDHGINSSVYFIDNVFDEIATKAPLHYATSPDVDWKFNSGVATGLVSNMNPDDIPDSFSWKPTRNRSGTPLRPHDTHIDGVRSSDERIISVGGEHAITWRTRNRDTLTVSRQLDPAEPGELVNGFHQVHRVMVIDSASVVHDCGATSSSADANSLNITVPTMAEGSGELYVRSEMLIGGTTYISIYEDRLPVYVLPGIPRTTEDDEYRTTEDDEYRIIE